MAYTSVFKWLLLLLLIIFLLDLVPVSSTVIPLYTHQVNSTDDAKYHPLSLAEEEYRIAYMKLLMHKKHAEAPEEPDTLITCNSDHTKSLTVAGGLYMLILCFYSN